MFIINIKKNIYYFASILLINWFLWHRILLSFVLNGDDIYELLGAPEYLSNFILKISTFTGQYRPLGRIFYNLYLPFEYNFHLLYEIHLIHLCLVQYIFFIIVKNHLSFIKSLLLTFFVFWNPIFYYHIFVIASDINLMIIGLLLLGVYFIQRKEYIWVIVLFFISIFIKETFIVLLPIALFSIIKLDSKSVVKQFLTGVVFSLTIGYVLIRFKNYVPLNDSYRFIFKFSKALYNFVKIFALNLNLAIYSRKLPLISFQNLLNIVVAGCLGFLWLFSIIKSVKMDLMWVLVLLSILVCSIAPFIFLNSFALYDMDITFVVFGMLLVPLLLSRYSTYISLLLFGLTFLTRILFINDWVNYSFVGNSNKLATNFIKIIEKSNINNKTDICIINHSWGWWPTASGRLSNFIINNYSGHISSFMDDNVSDCANAFILRNVRQDYVVLKKND